MSWNIKTPGDYINGPLTVAGSATITGDLTVRTNKLFVNATGVGIGNAGPLSALTVSSQTDARLSVRTTEAVFGSITGGTALDSLNDAANALVPFGCRGSTVSFAASGQNVGLQLDASSNVNVPLGNVVMGTSGKGIDFTAAGNAAGMTSELLNDYEEGTWQGTLIGNITTPASPIVRTGKYTKIGRQVSIAIYFENVDTTGYSGAVSIQGLPFTEDGSRANGTLACYNFNFNLGTSLFVNVGVNTLYCTSSLTNSNWRDVLHSAGALRFLQANVVYYV